MRAARLLLMVILLLLTACAPDTAIPTLPPDLLTEFPPATATLPGPVRTATFSARLSSGVQKALTATALPAELTRIALPAPSKTPTPSPSPTPGPYAGLSIAELAARSYGGGELTVDQDLGRGDGFTRARFHYLSDGLDQYGFVDVPDGDGPFPVVILIHGYIDPAVYSLLDYTTRYADSLARAGYLVLHPTLRGYSPSQDGPNLHRVGFAVDVLNLAALVRQQGGQPGALQKADPQRIGLFGHSMGGGVAIRVMTVDPAIRAVLLYGSMSADERANAEQIYFVFSDQSRAVPDMDTPPEVLDLISPVFFLARVKAAVSIHHGELDDQVPPDWSADLCKRLNTLGTRVECFTYPGAGHTFSGDADQLFQQRAVSFFERELRP